MTGPVPSSPSVDDIPLTFIGHPFAPIGMGEQLRSHVAACNSLRLHHRVLDLFRHAGRTDSAHDAVLGDRERRDAPGGIRVFHLNGDEIERGLAAFGTRGGDFAAGFNVVVPAWELRRYPKVWAEQLQRFDEVWAISRFVRDSLAAAGIASHVIGQSVEPPPGPLLPRRWFGIRESAFVLLHTFDVSSYAARKNPEAVLALFEMLRAERPFADMQLVLKVKDGEQDGAAWAADLDDSVRDQGSRVLVLTEPLDTLAMRSLIAACDCFVSLHRAEGFGRGLGEAMALGRIALATGWSGNLDFMTPDNALLAGHRLVRVRRDQYPHAAGQSWAEPDVAHAASLLRPVLDDPARGAALATRARLDVLRSSGNRAVGLRILDRLEQIVTMFPDATGRPARQASRTSSRC